MECDAQALAAIFSDLTRGGAAADDRAPGGVAAIIRGGEVTALHVAGCANLATGLRWSAQTRGRIASVSKPMAAQVLLTLCDGGHLDLDMRLGDGLALSPAWARLKLRDALAMKAGLPDEYALMALATGLGIADHHDLDHRFRLLAAQSHLNFDARARTMYANTGFTLAQRLAEAVTGDTFAGLLARTVFEPAGMETAAFGRSAAPLASGVGLGTRAVPGGVEPSESWIDVGAAGGVVASMTDLVAWHLWNRGDAATLWARLAAPIPHDDGSPSGYAIGIERKTISGHRTEGHSGGISGWACDYVRLPDLDAAVIVLANRTDVNWYERCREAAVHAFGLAPDPAATPRLVRTASPKQIWEANYGDRIGGRSFRLRGGPEEVELEGRRYPRSEDGGFRRILGTEPVILDGIGDGASAPETITIQEGAVAAACQMASGSTPPHDRLCGVYAAESMPGRIVIADINGQPHVAFGWRWPAAAPMRLAATFADLWRALDMQGAPGDLHFFWPDLDGDADRLEVSTVRLVRFPYRRIGDAAAAAQELTWTLAIDARGAAP